MALSETDFVWSESYPKESDDRLNVEVFPADQLDRGRYAWFLTNYLVEEGKNNGYVLNINASWGTGKTYFLNRWKAVLEKEYPVVYIDAWKQDYSDDPLLTVVASIISQLRSLAGKEAEEFVISAAEKAVRLFKAAAPAITKGLVKKATGVKIDEIADSWQDESSGVAKPVGDLGAGEAAGKMVEALINDHNAKLQGVDAFKKSMNQWIEAVIGNQDFKYPAFIFIDELDRCRPPYAVEMLEVIKHFFEMKNVVFVVATDTEQLQHAVKAIYGQGFNSGVYLSRFFRRRFTLSEPNYTDFIKTQFTSNNVNIIELAKNAWPSIDKEGNGFIPLISTFCQLFELSLRDTEQLIDRIVSILRVSGSREINMIIIISLLILHDKYHDFYRVLMSKSILNKTKLNEREIDDSIIRDHLGQQFVSSHKVSVEIFKSRTIELSFSVLLENTFNILQRFDTPSKKSEAIHELNHKLATLSRENSNKKLLALNSLKVDLDNTIETYKNWVELATSFDD